MTFDYPGYPLAFVQKKQIKDNSSHLFTLVYKFYSTHTKLNYVLHADYHEEDVFAIKFYCKKDKRSEYKYSKIVNKGDVGNILITCARVVPLLLVDFPTASFGFSGARSIDERSKKVEDYSNNQRFRLYRYVVSLVFGTKTFTHYEYEQISSYLLINNGRGDIASVERRIVKMFSETYSALPDI